MRISTRASMTLTRILACLVVGTALGAPQAGAHDVSNRISMHAFVKPEGQRLHLLVRVPLPLLPALDLPKRGRGFIDLQRADEHLERGAAATAKAFEIRADGERLVPVRASVRVTPPSDRSFESYEQALALMEGPPLHAGIDVLWNRGYLDVHLEHPIRSDRSDFVLEVHPDRALGDRVTADVRFLPPGGAERVYVLRGEAGPVALDPRWHQAAWIFVKSGVHHIMGGLDHLLFLLCLVLPFRRLGWNVVGVVTAFTVAHSITLISAAYGFVPAGEWFPPLVETLIAASIIYMAVENVIAPNLPRRWLVTGIFGLVHGFGFSFALGEELQFAGGHLVLSLFAFNVGIEIGQIVVLAAVLPLLAWLARRPLALRYTSLVVSASVAFIGWHWMVQRAEMLAMAPWPEAGAESVMEAARALSILLILGGLACWIVGRRARRGAAGFRAKSPTVPCNQSSRREPAYGDIPDGDELRLGQRLRRGGGNQAR